MAAPEREHGIDDCAEDASLEIVHRKVSLLDPLSLSLIQDPVKGLRCDHIEAFDRQVYIQYHQHLEKRPFVPRRRLWICPHCDKVAWPKDLQPAEAFRELLVAARSSPGVWNAIVRVDGSFALADDPVVAPGSAGSQRPRCEQLGAGDEGRSGTVLTTDFAKDQSTQAPAAVQRMLACNGIADAAADNDKAHSPLAQVIEVEEGSDTECPHATVKNGGLASSTSPSLVAAKATGVKRKKPDRDGCTAGTYFGGGLLSRVQGHGDVRSTDTAQRSTGCDGCSGNTSATPPGPQGELQPVFRARKGQDQPGNALEAANESMCNACGGLRRSQNGSDVGGRGVGGTIKLWLQSRPTRCSCVSVTEDEALEVQATTGVGAATASEGATPAEDEALEVQATTGVGAATASEGATPAEDEALEVQATTGVGAATASEGATPAEDEGLEVQAITSVAAATASEGATPAEETAAVVAGPAVAAPSLSAAAAATAAWACGTRGKSEISSGSGGANAESVTVEHGKRGAAKNAFRTTSRGGASRGTRGRKAIGRI
eukprot:TRINITY_DN5117_c0_g1_i4.p1 TRINITY_DN5117_c0_g1~~TRINITY_DN5117_c0_g1_i4.p1  ORF type:complete len:584 (+),score=102.86 TRINITY_DN5117_c0_g1_i4:120-1754(+)